MRSSLVTAGRVVRDRRPAPGERGPKAQWVIHRDDCQFAPGCTPLADLVEEISERGVLVRLRRGWIARCVTCRPTVVEVIPEDELT